MKKTIAILLMLCTLLSIVPAMAANHPFESGVNYSSKWNENGAVPSMLNFGFAELAPGEALESSKGNTIKTASAKNVTRTLNTRTYYCYAKWQHAAKFDYMYIDALLVLTDPNGDNWAIYQEAEVYDSPHNATYSWFFDVNDALERCSDANGGTLPRGNYSFSLFFNNQSFRAAKFKLT